MRQRRKAARRRLRWTKRRRGFAKLRWVQDLSEWWHTVAGLQLSGAVLFLIGAVLTVWAAVARSGTQLVIAIVAIVFQIGAARMFAGHGKVNPIHAKMSARHLLQLAKIVDNAEIETRAADSQLDRKALADKLRSIGLRLSIIQEVILRSADDWIIMVTNPHEMKTRDELANLDILGPTAPSHNRVIEHE
jgi:hypothetical protein